MSKIRAKHANCFVVGCTNEHKSLYALPSAEDLRSQWIFFIFDGNIPTITPKVLYVCANHFTSDCFLNESQYRAGFASNLKIRPGSIPTVRDPSLLWKEDTKVGIFNLFPATRDVACQTDPLRTHTTGTQLSAKTLQPHIRSAAVQTAAYQEDSGASTAASANPPCFSSPSLKRPRKRPRLDPEVEEVQVDPYEGSSSAAAPLELCAACDPADSAAGFTESTVLLDEASTSTHNIRKYIVYENCIMELFAVCPMCMGACDVQTRRLGTFLSVEQRCPYCNFYRHWSSQPILGSTPAGNLHLSAAVYLNGASFFKIKRIFEAMQLQIIPYDTFQRHARAFIEPAVLHHWKTKQEVMLQRLSEEDKAILQGVSAGHSAKFAGYTTMDLKTNTVIDTQLVQRVGNRHHVEREGLRMSLALLNARGVTPDCIITDHNPQIQTFLHETGITHYYDVSHIEKGISKKLENIGKMKDCEKLQKWMKSIKNHVYWTAASSTSGPERVAKWTSIVNHVQDIHTHEDRLYPQCLHDPRQTRDTNQWLSAASPALHRLEKVMTNRKTLKDVEKLSPHDSSFSVKALRSTIARFTMKSAAFPPLRLLCRLYLAAMDHNENANRWQVRTAKREALFRLHFPTSTKGECSAKPVRTEPTFEYVADLMDLIFEKVVVDPAPYVDAVMALPCPEDLTAQCHRPDRGDVIAHYVTRFNRVAV